MGKRPLKNPELHFDSIIHRILPHRYPFLLVDRITQFTPGIEIHGIKNFTADEPILFGYGPSSPAVPMAILLEAVTQLGAILVLQRPEMAGKIAMVLQIPSAKVTRLVAPGDSVRFAARVLKLRDMFGELRGSAYLANETIAEGQMRFAITDRPGVLRR